MSKFLRASAALSLLAIAGTAHAADLPRRGAPAEPYYATPVPTFSWTGFYLGLNAGYTFGSFTNGSSQLFGNPNGFAGGVTGGFNWQAAQNIVVGVEGDWDITGINNRNAIPFFGFSGTGKVDSLATIRGRVGYAADRALLYVTGGLALASVSANVADFRAIPFFGSTSSIQPGFALGGGIEYAFTNSISAKAEYIFTSTGPKEAFAYTPDWVRLGTNLSTVRAGVNYHF